MTSSSQSALDPSTDDDLDYSGPLTRDPDSSIEAFYRLESWVVCPHCEERIEAVGVVRLLRAQVNFISTLPRKGQVAVCPECRSIVPVQLTGFM